MRIRRSRTRALRGWVARCFSPSGSVMVALLCALEGEELAAIAGAQVFVRMGHVDRAGVVTIGHLELFDLVEAEAAAHGHRIDVVDRRGVEAEDLVPYLRRDLGVTVRLAHPCGDLEHAQRGDLPLGTAVEHG